MLGASGSGASASSYRLMVPDLSFVTMPLTMETIGSGEGGSEIGLGGIEPERRDRIGHWR